MDHITQQNASLAEQAAAASEAMQDQAGKLAQVVSVFKLDSRQTAVAACAKRESREPRERASPISRKTAPHWLTTVIERQGLWSTLTSQSVSPVSPSITSTQPANGDEWEQF
jgi:methyl-accepting chemotaxis protein